MAALTYNLKKYLVYHQKNKKQNIVSEIQASTNFLKQLHRLENRTLRLFILQIKPKNSKINPFLKSLNEVVFYPILKFYFFKRVAQQLRVLPAATPHPFFHSFISFDVLNI
jgi:hypothetical protein